MQVKTNAGYIFDQLSFLLQSLTDEQYHWSCEEFYGASIGKHYRHIIEFFQCVSVADQTGTICYDNRPRDERIEKIRSFALQALSDLQTELSEIDDSKILTMIGDISAGNNSEGSVMSTSLFREFHYAIEHAIHHMAILKMGIRHAFPDILIPDEFGVAPSTVRFRRFIELAS
ncbi:MAG: hypothetical protein H0W62_10765 [Chitinophagales bacterium]|nr:hypothetical protein [Chitinophagales bacterium]